MGDTHVYEVSKRLPHVLFRPEGETLLEDGVLEQVVEGWGVVETVVHVHKR